MVHIRAREGLQFHSFSSPWAPPSDSPVALDPVTSTPTVEVLPLAMGEEEEADMESNKDNTSML